MGKKEKQAKAAAFAMQKELDSEMGDEERAAREKSGMGLFGGLNKGEDQLFGTAARLLPLHARLPPPRWRRTRLADVHTRVRRGSEPAC